MFSSVSRRYHGVSLAVSAVATGLLFAGSLGAQTLYGNLTGNVTDASNAAVPGATITVHSADTGLTRTATTDGSGNYQISDLPQGAYVVTITGTGFGTVETKGVLIAVNQTKRIDAALALGSVTQSVDVNTAPPALQTDRADVNYEISPTQVSQLPTAGSSGRNFQNLFRLIPGIPPPQEMNSQAGNPGRTQAVNANGVANTVNSTKIDGASVGYPWLQSEPSYIPPQDAIESANIVTNSFNAEQGEAGGISANIIVKTGTNTFHGSAWEYNSISQFNARNYFTPLHRHWRRRPYAQEHLQRVRRQYRRSHHQGQAVLLLRLQQGVAAPVPQRQPVLAATGRLPRWRFLFRCRQRHHLRPAHR